MNIELNKEKENLCCICLEKIIIENKNLITILLDCKHEFHQKCIDKWCIYKNYTCPYCRNRISGVYRYSNKSCK